MSEADVWFRRLEPNSIKTWSEFKMEFLNQFIPAAKTNALRREIREVTQWDGENLSKYWHRYRDLLDACPNHNMLEVEVYSRFYEGMDAKSKDLINSSSGGSFYKLRLSKAKSVLGKLLNAKREYDDAAVTPSREEVKSTPTEDRDDLLKSRIDKLEETLQSVIESRQHPLIPNQPHFRTDQVNFHQNTGEVWSSNTSWNRQTEVYQQEYPHCGEWSWTEEYPTFPYHAEPYPISTQTPSWQMGYPHHQPYPKFQRHEFNTPTYQSDYSSHYTSFPSHPYQTYPSEVGAQLPTWSNEDWQIHDTHYHQNQTCPDQHQYQSQPQQSFGPPLDENHYANSTEGEIEGLTVSQKNVQHCLKPDEKLVLEMQRTYNEQQSNMYELIKQVALLTEVMKEIQGNRARSEVNESWEEAEGVSEPEESEPLSAEHELEVQPEKQEEVRTAEAEPAEEEIQAEEEPVATALEDETSQEIPEGANDEPQKKGEEVIKPCVGLGATSFYLQARKVHILDEKVERSASEVEGETAPAERSSPVIDKSEEYGYEEEGPEPKKGGTKRRAARFIYWVQLQPWPEPLKVKEPPDPGLRPKQNKKVQGTYKNHKKKQAAMVVVFLQEISG